MNRSTVRPTPTMPNAPSYADLGPEAENAVPGSALIRDDGASASAATTMASQRLYTVDEACAILRIKRTLFYSLLAQRRLQSIQIGSRRVIPAKAIVAFIREQLEAAG